MLGTESAFGPQYPFVKEKARQTQANSLSPIALIIGVGAAFPQRSQAVERYRARILTELEIWPHQLRVNEYLGKTRRGVSEVVPPAEEFDVSLQRRKYTFAVWNLGGLGDSVSETVTPAAEKFAKALGIYGALVLTKEIIREQMGSAMTGFHVDRRDDPDESGFSTICFTITTHESVDSMLQRDNDLQEALISRLPPNACLQFSFDYQFE